MLFNLFFIFTIEVCCQSMEDKKEMSDKKSPTEWKEEISPEQYRIAFEKGTEAAFTGIYNNHKDTGTYNCSVCDNPLFTSNSKFESGCGWPAFFKPVSPESVNEHVDVSHGMSRTEITCNNCNAHLGHVFSDGPQPSGLRYCINSVSLEFQKED